VSEAARLTLMDLLPRQREAILYLWTGHSPKQVAAAMRISPVTVKCYISEVARRLPGACGNVQKIMLWQTRVLCPERGDPTFSQLQRLLTDPTLPAHPGQGSNAALAGGCMR
jgi:hypothetical protein